MQKVYLYGNGRGNADRKFSVEVRTIDDPSQPIGTIPIPVTGEEDLINEYIFDLTSIGGYDISAAYNIKISTNKDAALYGFVLVPGNTLPAPDQALTITLNPSANVNVGDVVTLGIEGGNGGTVKFVSNEGNVSITPKDDSTAEFTASMPGTYQVQAIQDAYNGYAGSNATISITVTCSDPVPYISPESGAIKCTRGVELSLYYENPGGTTGVANVSYAWYYRQDDSGTWQKIDGATSDTYTATSAGMYKALVTAICPQWTGNEAEVTLSQNDPPVVEKLTPFQYYQLDSLYAVTGREMRHLFKVTPKGTGDNPYQVSATIHRGSTISLLSNIDWITSKNNTDTLIADYDKLTKWSINNTKAIREGDTIVVKVTPRNMCNEIDAAYADSINIIVLNRSTHTIAYVVSGDDVNNL